MYSGISSKAPESWNSSSNVDGKHSLSSQRGGKKSPYYTENGGNSLYFFFFSPDLKVKSGGVTGDITGQAGIRNSEEDESFSQP